MPCLLEIPSPTPDPHPHHVLEMLRALGWLPQPRALDSSRNEFSLQGMRKCQQKGGRFSGTWGVPVPPNFPQSDLRATLHGDLFPFSWENLHCLRVEAGCEAQPAVSPETELFCASCSCTCSLTPQPQDSQFFSGVILSVIKSFFLGKRQFIRSFGPEVNEQRLSVSVGCVWSRGSVSMRTRGGRGDFLRPPGCLCLSHSFYCPLQCSQA